MSAAAQRELAPRCHSALELWLHSELEEASLAEPFSCSFCGTPRDQSETLHPPASIREALVAHQVEQDKTHRQQRLQRANSLLIPTRA